MKLLERYATQCGLKIGKQYLNDNFFALPFEKYITFHCGSGQNAKNYPFWNEVVFLIKKILEDNGISIVVLGKDPDFQIQGCHNVVNQTNISQTNYLLRNSLLHVCNDTWTAHRAGFLNIPLVEIFGSTSIANHSPYNYNKEKTVFIESHRFGKNPSFQSQEFPQTIALIPPEDIANSIFKVLDINSKITKKSLLFGQLYQQTLIELVPNCVLPPQFQMPNPLIVRMDYNFDEQSLFENLNIRNCIIITDKMINLNILAQFSKKISLIRIEVDNINKEWIKAVERLGIKTAYFSKEKNSDKLSKKRLDLLNTCFVEQISFPEKTHAISNIEIYLNKKLEENFDINQVKFKTNKFLFADNKFYLSKAHWKFNQNIENIDNNHGDIIDNDDFWMDQNYFYFYN